MDFNAQVRKSLKTEEQLRKEAADAEVRKEYEIAEYNYKRLKYEILQKAQRAKAVRGTISGIFTIKHDGNNEDDVPYSNPFDVQMKSKYIDLPFFHIADHKSFEVKNMAKLDAVFAKMRNMAEADGIALGEPFLRGTIRDWETRGLKKEMRFARSSGRLSGKLRFVYCRGGGKLTGEQGLFDIAVEYEYHI